MSHKDMGHKVVDYLVCAELKRSIKRAHIRQGLKSTDNSYKALLSFLRGAARQAERQAFVAMKRPDVANSDVILIAASGPFWMWCLASHSDLLRKFSNTVMEDLLDEAKAERDKDSAKEESDIPGDDDDDLTMDPTLPFQLLYSTPYCRKMCSSSILPYPGLRL